MYLSLIIGDPVVEDEAVAWSARFKTLSDSRLSFISDLSKGSGEILSEGPTGEFDASVPGDLHRWADTMMSTALGFLNTSIPLISGELNRRV